MAQVIRVQLDLNSIVSPFTNHLWISVDRESLSTVKDFKYLLYKKFAFLNGRNINLYVKKCLLLDDETILILRDEDIVRVVCEEQPMLRNVCGDVNEENEDKKNESSEKFGLRKKLVQEVRHVVKKQKLLSSSPCDLISPANSDSETPCSKHKCSGMSKNESQEFFSNFRKALSENEGNKRKKKKKKSKHDHDKLKDLVDPEHNISINVKMPDNSDYKDGNIDKKKKCHILSPSSEKAEVIAMCESICKDYSSMTVNCQINDTNVANKESLKKFINSQISHEEGRSRVTEENLVELKSSVALLNEDKIENINEENKDSETEVDCKSPSKDKSSELSGNNCPKKKRKRRRRKRRKSKESDNLILNDSLKTNNLCTDTAVSTIPKNFVTQPFQPGVCDMKGSAPKHTFFEESLNECDPSLACEQPVNANETACLTQGPNVGTTNGIEAIVEVADLCDGKEISENVPSLLQKSSSMGQEQLVKKLENSVHLEGSSWQRNLAKPYSEYPPMKSFPSIGSVIAFKILELSSSYCPEISAYKEGRVINVYEANGDLEIELISKEIIVREGKFENIYPEDIPEPATLTNMACKQRRKTSGSIEAEIKRGISDFHLKGTAIKVEDLQKFINLMRQNKFVKKRRLL